MKVKIIPQPPEHVMSRGFTKFPKTDYDAVVIIRNPEDIERLASTLIEFAWDNVINRKNENVELSDDG
jgi:hypothetical protein